MMMTSAFEILGPVMVGPSSSHTAGALRIALVARELAPDPLKHVSFELFNSFSHTYRGHGTDRALVAGMLGLTPDDIRVRDSFALAEQQHLSFDFIERGDDPALHPNTVVITMEGDGDTCVVTGESVGGGRVRLSKINGVSVEVRGDYPTVFIVHDDRAGVLAELTRVISGEGLNIATLSNYRERKGGKAYTIIESDEYISPELIAHVRTLKHILFAASIEIPGASRQAPDTVLHNGFDCGEELLAATQSPARRICDVMYAREVELMDEEAVRTSMRRVLEVMREETHAPLSDPEPSLGGLIGGQAQDVWQAKDRLAACLMGSTLTRAVAYAMATLERSATMGVMVAAPTAGSAGVVPGSILAVGEALGADDEALMDALWTAAAVGAIIAQNASVSGAEGGCQAEVGSASAMAAAALVELLGGTPDQALDAASIAIGNLLGLVCDPVRGLVEYPCQDRNAIGVANAISAAQLSLSGVVNPLPFDQVVGALKSVGDSLPTALRETAKGGLAKAASCSGCMRCSIQAGR
ncbi:MAG: L-serine ammonia-lyase, iron-sulfur-dependent, subunit alpha [Atopobiaceae bacterium]|jgi:L-serine dehydratase